MFGIISNICQSPAHVKTQAISSQSSSSSFFLNIFTSSVYLAHWKHLPAIHLKRVNPSKEWVIVLLLACSVCVCVCVWVRKRTRALWFMSSLSVSQSQIYVGPCQLSQQLCVHLKCISMTVCVCVSVFMGVCLAPPAAGQWLPDVHPS